MFDNRRNKYNYTIPDYLKKILNITNEDKGIAKVQEHPLYYITRTKRQGNNIYIIKSLKNNKVSEKEWG